MERGDGEGVILHSSISWKACTGGRHLCGAWGDRLEGVDGGLRGRHLVRSGVKQVAVLRLSWKMPCVCGKEVGHRMF